MMKHPSRVAVAFLSQKVLAALALLVILCFYGSNCVLAQRPDKKAVLKYLAELPRNNSKRVVSGQFESWGVAIKPLSDKDNCLNLVHQQTDKWVGLVGAEYHNGQEVNYVQANQLFEQHWSRGGFCQLYLIMTNPAQPASINGGGRCDIKLVLNPNHSFSKYFYSELDKVAAGLAELQKKGVVVFLNMFPEATASWFWWGGDRKGFIDLYRSAHDYLVTQKGLDNLLFIYEPCSGDNLAVKFYPGDKYVDIIGFSLFVDWDREITESSISNYGTLKEMGKPLAISQWGPRRGKDQTGANDQPPADNLKLIRGIQKYFPEIVWWMNWNCAYSICTASSSSFNSTELLNHPWVINRDEIKLP
jgi:mannan endo-1,4-beta-mannosidase